MSIKQTGGMNFYTTIQRSTMQSLKMKEGREGGRERKREGRRERGREERREGGKEGGKTQRLMESCQKDTAGPCLQEHSLAKLGQFEYQN